MEETPLAPAFLVAMNAIVDANFKRTVVLMLHSDDDGSLGLVLNRGTDIPIAELCRNLEIEWAGTGDATVDWGGPVGEDEGWVLVGESAEKLAGDAQAVADGLSFTRSQDALRGAPASSGRVRVFLGYAGWGAGQLEDEIAEGAWLVVPFSQALVFDEDRDGLWEKAIRSMGIEPATLVMSQGVN